MNSKYKTDLSERSFELSVRIIETYRKCPKNDTTRIIANQIIRSSTSIGANIVEAKASSSRKEFKKFNEIALRSANESIYWLRLSRKVDLITKPDYDKLCDEVEQLCKMLASGIKKLKN